MRSSFVLSSRRPTSSAVRKPINGGLAVAHTGNIERPGTHLLGAFLKETNIDALRGTVEHAPEKRIGPFRQPQFYLRQSETWNFRGT